MARLVSSDPFHGLNEWVADYLAEKGFMTVLKALRVELKNDKTSNVDSLIDYINHCTSVLNLQGLTEIWQELDRRLFSRLHDDHAKAAVTLEERLLKLFIVTALLRGNPKKAQDCLEHMANNPRLCRNPELKDWFQVPYMKHPEADSLCAKYCSKFWQETLNVSLYNFISSAYQTAANDLLVQRLKCSQPSEVTGGSSTLQVRKLQDTFGRSNESSSMMNQKPSETVNPLRNKFIKAIQSMNAIPRRHPDHADHVELKPAFPVQMDKTLSSPLSPSRQRQRSNASESSALSINKSPRAGSSNSVSHSQFAIRSPSTEKEHDLVFLSQSLPYHDAGVFVFHLVCEEDLGSHDHPVVDCVFSACGTKVVSYDNQGCVKTWKGIPPATRLHSSYECSTGVSCVAWSSRTDDLIVVGDLFGKLRLIDGAFPNSMVIMEVDLGSRISALALGNELENSFIACGTDGTEESQFGIFVIDLATFSIRSELRHTSRLTACTFHPSRNVLLCGFDTGDLSEFSIKFQKFSGKFPVHSSAVQQVEYLKDEAYCISVGNDSKLIISYLTLGGRKLAEITLNLPLDIIPYPLRHTFALNSDGTYGLIRSRSGAKIYKIKGKMTACFTVERNDSSATSVDWYTASDKSTGVIGFCDGKIRWFRLLHLS